MIFNWGNWGNLCACCKSKKKLNDEEITSKALKMLNDWSVSIYANNKYLHKIPEERKKKQYMLFIKELKNNR